MYCAGRSVNTPSCRSAGHTFSACGCGGHGGGGGGRCGCGGTFSAMPAHKFAFGLSWVGVTHILCLEFLTHVHR